MSASEPFPAFPYPPDPRESGAVVGVRRCLPGCGKARGFHLYRALLCGPRRDRRGVVPVVHRGTDPAAREVRWGLHGRRLGAFPGNLTFPWPPFGPDPEADARVPRLAARNVGSTTAATGRPFSEWWAGRSSGRTRTRSKPSSTSTMRTAGRPKSPRSTWPRSTDDQPTAYLFRCRHCGKHLAYSDFTWSLLVSQGASAAIRSGAGSCGGHRSGCLCGGDPRPGAYARQSARRTSRPFWDE